MNNVLKAHMDALKNIIEEKKEGSRKAVWEQLEILIREFPDDKDAIIAKFNEYCKTYNVDYFSKIRVDGTEIKDYVEKNVP